MSNTIPANQIVQVNPGVVGAGGNALVMNGMLLTTSTRVPIGTYASFVSAAAVGAFFGLSSNEYAEAQVYFAGFQNSTAKPGSVLFAQYNPAAVPAYLESGPISNLTLAQLQAINGTLSVVMDGVARAGSINLAAASSFSAAAGLIQTALNAAPTQQASFTGSISAQNATFTGSINGNLLTVSAVGSGQIVTGGLLGTAGGIAANTHVVGQLSGTGGVGTYFVDVNQNVASSALMVETWGQLTVSAVASGTLSVGQTVSGSGVGVLAGQVIGQQISGTAGGIGVYAVGLTQTTASGPMTTAPTALTVSYDSTSGAMFVTSGISGPASTSAFATGTAAAALSLVQANGAILSQGANGASPNTFMTSLAKLTQNWATFTTLFDPDFGSGNAQKQLFAAWTNLQNNRYAYICWDTDITPTESANAPTSLGQILKANNSSGICLIYEPNNLHLAAFVCGTAASIDFNRQNGRITFAFKGQAGLSPSVTDEQIAANLIANGYNFYGAYATANQSFIWFYNGSVSGEFLWLDSYVNQIWLNNALQLAEMELLQNTNSVPYNQPGYDLVEAAAMDPINAALNFGAIRAGVPLSAAQAAEVNAAAGVTIDTILSQRGWYLQVVPATAQVRAARTSPTITLWYMDGQAVQQIVIASEEVE